MINLGIPNAPARPSWVAVRLQKSLVSGHYSKNGDARNTLSHEPPVYRLVGHEVRSFLP